MLPLPFSLLYGLCLGVCLGAVELLQASWVPEPVPEVTLAEEVIIAVPPKPEGVKQGAGEEEIYRYTEAKCRSLDGDYRDICYHQLARQSAATDLAGATVHCGQVADREVGQECLSDIAELHAETDREAALAICPTIGKKKWRDQCVFGISLAMSTLDSPWAFRLCDKAGKWRDFCRHDVNGEIAQVDHELALAHCAAEEGDLLRRKTCWHGLGKYIARVDVDRAFEVCERVPLGPANLYRENCMHGLGWGASESAGADFVDDCTRAGARTDSCLLGVAYNLRRFDIGSGMKVCAKVKRTDLRGQCEAFVQDGRLGGSSG